MSLYCLKIEAQKLLNLKRVSESGITAGTFFMVLPETSLNVEPDAIPSITGRLCYKK